jgi:hypothetical protein
MVELTDIEAAKIAGCSRVAIFNARKKNHIETLASGKISSEALTDWIKGRRAPRGNRRKIGTELNVEVPPGTGGRFIGCAETLAADDELAIAADAVVAAAARAKPFASRAEAELHRDTYVALMRQIQYDHEPPRSARSS